MSVNNDYDHQEVLDALDTLSLTDYPLTQDPYSVYHRNPPSPATSEDLFEFCSGTSGVLSNEHRMSHAEDMFSEGKLAPINDQITTRKTSKVKHIHRRRSESMHELKSTNNNGISAKKLVRNSYSLDYKKLNRNSRLNHEPTANNLSNKTSSSRWSDLVFGPLKGAPEMDLQDIRNRQVVNTSKALFMSVESSNRFSGYHRKTSWGVLGILSCKSSGSVEVNMPLSYERLSLKN
ncbi:uncharacterized protein LOC143575219 [Bidens hawaiensis]|uniref:uncharacterized protein LOC143575219 n=1 Tax=Bidens hawaiensis TaxID=980011 RepID=UPI00404B2B87